MGKSMNSKGKMSHTSRAHKRGENKAPSGLTYKRKTKRGWSSERVR